MGNQEYDIPAFVRGESTLGLEKYVQRTQNERLHWISDTFKGSEIDRPKYFFISKKNLEKALNRQEPAEYRALDLPFKNVILESNCAYFRVPAQDSEDQTKTLKTYSIFCHEKSPGNLVLAAGVTGPIHKDQEDRIGVANMTVDEHVFRANNILHAVFNIKNGATFIDEKVKQRFKVGSKGGREIIKVSRITHITFGRDQKSVTPVMGGTIEWNHCWGVRGHWRIAGGLGKDREGNYTVSGYTWVSPHLRGDKNAPFVEKTKILKILKSKELHHA